MLRNAVVFAGEPARRLLPDTITVGDVTLDAYYVANLTEWTSRRFIEPVAFVCAISRTMPGAFAQTVAAIRQSWPTSLIIAVEPGAERKDIVAAMRAGAWDVLTDDFQPEAIAASLASGLNGVAPLGPRVPSASLCQKWASLSLREREILQLVVDGKLTKVIAHELGISAKTVDIHRTNIKRKFGNDSVASLVNMVISGGGYKALCAT